MVSILIIASTSKTTQSRVLGLFNKPFPGYLSPDHPDKLLIISIGKWRSLTRSGRGAVTAAQDRGLRNPRVTRGRLIPSTRGYVRASYSKQLWPSCRARFEVTASDICKVFQSVSIVSVCLSILSIYQLCTDTGLDRALTWSPSTHSS